MNIIHKTGTQSADDPFRFIMSTDHVDRDGDVITQSGWSLADFRKNPIALFGHSSANPIGTWTDVKVEDGKLTGLLKMAKAGTSQLVDEVRSLLEQRILRAVSVGFVVDKSEPLEEDGPAWGPQRFLKQKLLECSVVSVPSNQQALMQRAKGLGISDETMNLAFGREGVPAPKRPAPIAKGVPARTKSNAIAKGITMSLAQRIKALETEVDTLQTTLNDLLEGTEGRDFTEDETTQIEALSAEIESKDAQLKPLKKAEAAINTVAAKNAATNPAPRRNTAPTLPHQRNGAAPVQARAKDPNDRPGCLLVKAAVVKTLAHAMKRGESDILAERYGSDDRKDAIDMILKAATNTATTTEAGWAAELVSNDTRGWIMDLEAISVFAALSAAGTGMDFAGANSVTVPGRDRTKKVRGSWVGENATIPVRDGAFVSIVLNRFKKAVLSVYSEELMNTSNPNIEMVLRDAMRIDTAESIDEDLLDASAGVSGVRPASILNGQPTQASAGTTLDNIHTDLRFLMDSLSAVNAGRNPILWMNPARSSGLSMLTNSVGQYVFRDEINNGSLMGYRLLTSTNVPEAVVGLTDAADFASAAGTPEFRVSSESTLVMLDDDGVDPTMADTNAVTVAGSVKVSDAAGVVGGPAKVKSMFQQYSQALRQIYPLSWQMMRSGTSPYLTAVSW